MGSIIADDIATAAAIWINLVLIDRSFADQRTKRQPHSTFSNPRR